MKQLGIFSLIVIIAIAIIRGPVTGILRGFGDGAVVTIEDVPGTYFVDKQNRWPTVLNTFKGEMAGCVSLIHLINHRWQVLVEIGAETITKPCGEKTARKLTDAIIDTLKPLPHGVETRFDKQGWVIPTWRGAGCRPERTVASAAYRLERGQPAIARSFFIDADAVWYHVELGGAACWILGEVVDASDESVLRLTSSEQKAKGTRYALRNGEEADLERAAFLVNDQFIGCHDEASEGSRRLIEWSTVVMRRVNVVRRMSDGYWYFTAEDNCWIRSTNAPVRLFIERTGASIYAAASQNKVPSVDSPRSPPAIAGAAPVPVPAPAPDQPRPQPQVILLAPPPVAPASAPPPPPVPTRAPSTPVLAPTQAPVPLSPRPVIPVAPDCKAREHNPLRLGNHRFAGPVQIVQLWRRTGQSPWGTREVMAIVVGDVEIIQAEGAVWVYADPACEATAREQLVTAATVRKSTIVTVEQLRAAGMIR